MTWWRLFRGRRSAEGADLDEWVRHHDDPRSAAGFALYRRVTENELAPDAIEHAWAEANRLVGQRAPADYGEFMAYGYLSGLRTRRLLDVVRRSR